MEFEFLDPTDVQQQMELLTMMLQMENQPEFYQTPPPFNNSSIQDYEYFSSATTGSTGGGGGSMSSSSPSSFPPPPPPPSVLPPSTVLFDPSMDAMREMVFRIAAMQPVDIDPRTVKAPKRRNVRISKDPQSVAARHRRERISERIRILQRLVPGGTKMDTASMLDEAIHYVKFLKSQLQSLEQVATSNRNRSGSSSTTSTSATTEAGFSTVGGGTTLENYWCYDNQQPQYNNVLR